MANPPRAYLDDWAPDFIRDHPWKACEGGQGGEQYYDFRAQPELIPKALEDFRPWDHHAAVQRFYEFLAWLNSEDSPFETSDCQFSGVNETRSSGISYPFESSGRVMIFFRDLTRNRTDAIVKLRLQLLEQINGGGPAGDQWSVALNLWHHRFLVLPPPEDDQVGDILVVRFWSFGADESSTMAPLSGVFEHLEATLRNLTEMGND